MCTWPTSATNAAAGVSSSRITPRLAGRSAHRRRPARQARSTASVRRWRPARWRRASCARA
eukprot:1894962-Prymnesium_polylepis.1